MQKNFFIDIDKASNRFINISKNLFVSFRLEPNDHCFYRYELIRAINRSLFRVKAQKYLLIVLFHNGYFSNTHGFLHSIHSQSYESTFVILKFVKPVRCFMFVLGNKLYLHVLFYLRCIAVI